jgi:hypothetical protein
MKITVNVPNGISIDATGVAKDLRSLADLLDEVAERQRRIAETSDPAAKLALQISMLEPLHKISTLTEAAVRATDVLRLLKSILDQADVSPERLLQ